jgi:anti-sigma factor RsiW
MSPEANHLGEAIQDLLDGRLAPEERARAEAHVAECAECRRELEALRWVKQMAAREAGRAAVPEHVRSAIAEALDRQDRSARAPAGARPQLSRTWRPMLAFGVVLAAVAAALLLWRGRLPDVPAAVARDFRDYEAGRLALALRTPDTQGMEAFFAAGGVGFETRVFDLGMMNFRLVGGRVHTLAGERSAFFVYEGPGGRILVCQMFRSRVTDLPAGAVLRQHGGIAFHVYQREGLTMVFWQEGEVACVLVSRGDPEEVVQLAFAKAVRSTRNEPPRGPRMAGLPGR